VAVLFRPAAQVGRVVGSLLAKRKQEREVRRGRWVGVQAIPPPLPMGRQSTRWWSGGSGSARTLGVGVAVVVALVVSLCFAFIGGRRLAGTLVGGGTPASGEPPQS
jgi:hypothetical protein